MEISYFAEMFSWKQKSLAYKEQVNKQVIKVKYSRKYWKQSDQVTLIKTKENDSNIYEVVACKTGLLLLVYFA